MGNSQMFSKTLLHISDTLLALGASPSATNPRTGEVVWGPFCCPELGNMGLLSLSSFYNDLSNGLLSWSVMG